MFGVRWRHAGSHEQEPDWRPWIDRRRRRRPHRRSGRVRRPFGGRLGYGGRCAGPVADHADRTARRSRSVATSLAPRGRWSASAGDVACVRVHRQLCRGRVRWAADRRGGLRVPHQERLAPLAHRGRAAFAPGALDRISAQAAPAGLGAGQRDQLDRLDVRSADPPQRVFQSGQARGGRGALPDRLLRVDDGSDQCRRRQRPVVGPMGSDPAAARRLSAHGPERPDGAAARLRR